MLSDLAFHHLVIHIVPKFLKCLRRNSWLQCHGSIEITWPEERKPATSMTVVNSLGSSSGLFTPVLALAEPTTASAICYMT